MRYDPEAISAAIRSIPPAREMGDSENLWNNPAIPKHDWAYKKIEDLEEIAAVCRMCGSKRIRYVHEMACPVSGKSLECGCVCAGRLEGSVEKANDREKKLKNLHARIGAWEGLNWRRNSKGNLVLKKEGLFVVVWKDGFYNRGWSWSIYERGYNGAVEKAEGFLTDEDSALMDSFVGFCRVKGLAKDII